MVKHGHTAPVFLAPVPSSYFCSGMLATLLVVGSAEADDHLPIAHDVPHEGDRAMPALLNVGLPVPAQEPVVFAATGGYGYLDPVLTNQNSGSRLRGSIGGAVSLAPFFLLGLDFVGRTDLFSSSDDDRANLYGEPRVTGRFYIPATKAIHLGAELDVRIIGAEAPDIDLSSTSPSLRGLFAAQLAKQTWLGAELGFHLDNSAGALSPPEAISSADRVTVGASSSPSVPFGVGASHRLGSGTELIGELSGEILVGEDAPSFLESPFGVALGARHPLSHYLAVMLSADVSLSARPAFDPEVFVPIQPRASGILTLIFRPFSKKEVQPEKPEPARVKPVESVKEEPTEPLIKTSSVQGTVVDEGGRPLPDVQVTMTREGGGSVEERTVTDGTFEFKEVPEGPVSLSIKTPGYDKFEMSFKEGEERTREVILYPSLPAGQVKGEVRDLQGKPLAATITIIPGNKVVQVKADGTFELELAPGQYTLRFEHPELGPQKRSIRVQDRGVVILNIGLSR